MASVEQQVEQEILQGNGDAQAGKGERVESPVETPSTGEIPVENPATGETIRTVPDLGADAVREMAARGRAAQPEWDAYGFDGRARVLSRAQKWLMDNAQRVTETIVSETGKTYEDASLAEIGYAGNAFGFWAKEGPHYLADESVKSSQVLVKGKKLILRYRPLGLIGVIGPWNVLIAARAVSGSTCEVSGCLSGVWPSRKQALTPRGVTLTLYTDLRYWLSASGCQLLDLTMFSPGPPRCSLLG